MSYLPDHKQGREKKPNRKAKQDRGKRKHIIKHESGGSLKERWRKTVEKSRRITGKNAREITK